MLDPIGDDPSYVALWVGMAEVWVRDCSRIQYHAHHAKRWWDAGGEGEGVLLLLMTLLMLMFVACEQVV